MKLGGRERPDDDVALEELFDSLSVTADWAIGFFTALWTAPDPIAPAMWTREIIPEGALDDDPGARVKVDTLSRLYGAVGETLRTTPEIVCPEPDKPATEAADFCRGYLHGARMSERWRTDAVAAEQLRPFETLAKENVDTDREHLGRTVAEVHAYWQSRRQVVNTAPKISRNDPCPCGSGKKHKKCCLAKQA